MRWFAAHPDEPLQAHSRDYLAWHRHMGTPKPVAKWILPLWSAQTARGIAVEVFGKDMSALDALGKVKVSSYIRYLMFEKSWSIDAVTEHLVDLGYSRNSARPQARRMFDAFEKQRSLWLAEKASTIKLIKIAGQ